MTNLNHTISHTVKTIMAARHIRRADIAHALGHSGEYVRQRLNGTHGWDIADLENLGKTLDATPGQLLGDHAEAIRWCSQPMLDLAREDPKAFALLVALTSSARMSTTGRHVDQVTAQLLAGSVGASPEHLQMLSDRGLICDDAYGVVVNNTKQK